MVLIKLFFLLYDNDILAARKKPVSGKDFLTFESRKMPYAQRNADGVIIALTSEPSNEHDVQLMPDDPEVLLFLAGKAVSGHDQLNLDLLADDLKMIRVVEDLIDILTSKGVILFSELPSAVQEKILRKKVKREQLSNSNDILVSDVNLL